MYARDSEYFHLMLGLAPEDRLPDTLVRIYEDHQRLKRTFAGSSGTSIDTLALMVQMTRMIDGPSVRVRIWDEDRQRIPFDYSLFRWSDAEPGSAVEVSAPGESLRYGRLAKRPKNDQPSVVVEFPDTEKQEHVLKGHVAFLEIMSVEPDSVTV